MALVRCAGDINDLVQQVRAAKRGNGPHGIGGVAGGLRGLRDAIALGRTRPPGPGPVKDLDVFDDGPDAAASAPERSSQMHWFGGSREAIISGLEATKHVMGQDEENTSWCEEEGLIPTIMWGKFDGKGGWDEDEISDNDHMLVMTSADGEIQATAILHVRPIKGDTMKVEVMALCAKQGEGNGRKMITFLKEWMSGQRRFSTVQPSCAVPPIIDTSKVKKANFVLFAIKSAQDFYTKMGFRFSPFASNVDMAPCAWDPSARSIPKPAMGMCVYTTENKENREQN